jgi:hypothetical protein
LFHAKARRGIEFQNLLLAAFAASREKILTGMDWGTETDPNQRSLRTARKLAVGEPQRWPTNTTMNRTRMFLLVVLMGCGCAQQNPPRGTRTYTEEKAYPEGLVVTAIVTAQEWAQDEPARTTRACSVNFDGKTEAVGTFKGEINRALRIRGVIVLVAYAEFSIRSTDGAWRHVNASTTAELQQQGIRFAVSQQPLTTQWKWLEIADVDPDGRAIVMRDRKDGSLFCISFDEQGSNLEFRSRQEANTPSQPIAGKPGSG